MKSKFKRRFIKGLIIFFIGFLLFFTFRLIYGYLTTPDDQTVGLNQSGYFDFSFGSDIKNYATNDFKKGKDKGLNENIIIPSTEQKYEKIASISSKTKNFDDDENKIRDTIKKYNALIQYEQNSGLTGNRLLNLSIGVNPDNFDNMKDEIITIGTITAIQVNNTDKTNEYKSLNAKKVSLINIKTSLIELKQRSGSIEELIQLENRILEIESEIQTLGVNLGEYDEENEFCTIKFSLIEATFKPASIPFIQRVRVALKWSVIYYSLFVGALFVVALVILIIITILEKLKWIPKSAEKLFNGD